MDVGYAVVVTSDWDHNVCECALLISSNRPHILRVLTSRTHVELSDVSLGKKTAWKI